jgi:pilus assembly protein CpaF
MESDVITLQEIFTFRMEDILRDRTVVGRLEATGLRPTFLHKFEKRGITLPNDLFVIPGAELQEFPARAAN